MREAEFSKRMYPRNGIEGTHSELVRVMGLGGLNSDAAVES